jgi:excisionase family DNA binding protein
MKSAKMLDMTNSIPAEPAHYTTIEVARLLGLAVRSVQLMVDRGELSAWKTAGGHRRISRASVEQWRAGQSVVAPVARVAGQAGGRRATDIRGSATTTAAGSAAPFAATPASDGVLPDAKVLLIEDSAHYQHLVNLVVRQQFPTVQLSVADDGMAGLALYGKIDPHVLIIDILLPGIDGAMLITTLRSHPQFARSRLLVITSLDEAQREPYAFALQGVPVIHKPQLVADLPRALTAALGEAAAA